MTAVDLIRLSVEIEHTIAANGDLLARPGKDPALFEVSQHTDGQVLYFWHEIPAALRAKLSVLNIDKRCS